MEQSELEVKIFPGGNIAVHFHEGGRCYAGLTSTVGLIRLSALRYYSRVKEGRDG